MKDLNRYVTRKHATDWYDIGIELGLELDILDIIENDHPQKGVTCFQKTLDKWLKLNTDDATWRTLEVALTNVNRAKLGLGPVDDVYGKKLLAACIIMKHRQWFMIGIDQVFVTDSNYSALNLVKKNTISYIPIIIYLAIKLLNGLASLAENLRVFF